MVEECEKERTYQTMVKVPTSWEKTKNTIAESPYMKAGLVAVLLIVVSALAFILIKTTILPGGPQSREELRGVTDEVTVETYSPNEGIPAQPRPETLPPIIKAEGPCKETLDQLRTVFETVPGWYAADSATQQQINQLLTEANPQSPGGTCDMTTYEKFIQQELVPWQNYIVPSPSPSEQSSTKND